MWPYHVVPDGNAALPHHYMTFLLAALVPLLIVWDDHRDREPWLVLCGILGGLASFGLVWARYPVIGATLSLVANALVILAPLRPAWSAFWPRRHRVAVILLGLGAADDVLQHAMGWPTPIDWVWKHGGRAVVVEAFGAVVGAV
ncbi:hypothetical protein [Haloarcula pellucida]|uniref:Uncharacterized protein n=1 Tax=Haloarcula pellucida TaxID=1427151 RepID=A0A830GPL7_9EURY|nr:hypothetical protein [Halomicroarcula pellucida]GGN97617.1 hypothetical protein GCM10009030_27030 [Halomicroarcula pellucida]